MEQHSLVWNLVILFIYQIQCCFGFANLSLVNEPQGGAIPENFSLLLACEATGQEPIDYFWRHNDRRLSLAECNGDAQWSFVNGSLRIEAVGQETIGLYQCCASNAFGVLCSRNVLVSLARLDIPRVLPANKEVEEGASIRLACQVDAVPARPKVTWLKDGIPVVLESPRIAQLPGGDGSIIHIAPSLPSDRGWYTCTASNEYGPSRTSEAAAVTVVDRTLGVGTDVPAEEWGISVGPADVDAVSGEDVILECLLYREENFRVAWRREDGRSIDMTRSKIQGQHNLRIRNVSTNDTAVYQCHAFDISREVEDVASALLYILQPPTFGSPMKDVNKSENALARLSCNVTGMPPPHVTWYHNGELVPITGRFSQMVSTRLVIWASQSQDAGIYQCSAVNEAGSIWGALYYQVIVPEHRPDPPSNVTVVVAGSESVLIHWSASATENLEGYSIYYYPTIDGSWAAQVVRSNVHQILMRYLQPYTNYTFQVKAFSREGGSEFTDHVYARTFEAKPRSSPQFWLTSSSPFSIHITWLTLPESERNGVINRYKICHHKEVASETVYTCIEKAAGSNSLLLNGLESATEYRVKMAAATSVGFGPDSQWAHIKTMDIKNCTVPVALFVNHKVINSTAVDITWSPSPVTTSLPAAAAEKRPDMLGFILTLTSLQDRSQKRIVFSKETHWVVLGGLVPGTAYNLEMQGYNTCGDGHVTVRTFQLNQFDFIRDSPILLPPFNLRATTLSPSSLILEWHPPQTVFTVLYYSIMVQPTQNPDKHFMIYSETCSKTLTNLRPFTEYFMKVMAHGERLSSSYSAPIYQRTEEDVPTAPTDVTLILTFQDTSPIVVVEWQPPAIRNGEIITYQISYWSLNATKEEPVGGTVSVNASILLAVIHDVEIGHHYTFAVRAFTSAGCSPPSKTAMLVVEGPKTEQLRPLERPFVNLGGDLEKGIAVGIVLATLCIMICTLLLVVRHRKDCRHQVCVTKKEANQPTSGVELVERGKAPDTEPYRPLSQQATHSRVRAQEDTFCQEPLLNGHIPTLPHDKHLTDTTTTASTTEYTSINNTKLPPHHHQDSTLPHSNTSHPSPEMPQDHQHSPHHCHYHQLSDTAQDTISGSLPLLARENVEIGVHRCLVHSDPTAISSNIEQHSTHLRDCGSGAGNQSPPRPPSYRGTNSDSGMDGDIDWDACEEPDNTGQDTGLALAATEGQSVDHSVYLSGKATQCGDYEDTNPDFLSRALYLCSADITHA